MSRVRFPYGPRPSLWGIFSRHEARWSRPGRLDDVEQRKREPAPPARDTKTDTLSLSLSLSLSISRFSLLSSLSSSSHISLLISHYLSPSSSHLSLLFILSIIFISHRHLSSPSLSLINLNLIIFHPFFLIISLYLILSLLSLLLSSLLSIIHPHFSSLSLTHYSPLIPATLFLSRLIISHIPNLFSLSLPQSLSPVTLSLSLISLILSLSSQSHIFYIIFIYLHSSLSSSLSTSLHQLSRHFVLSIILSLAFSLHLFYLSLLSLLSLALYLSSLSLLSLLSSLSSTLFSLSSSSLLLSILISTVSNHPHSTPRSQFLHLLTLILSHSLLLSLSLIIFSLSQYRLQSQSPLTNLYSLSLLLSHRSLSILSSTHLVSS
ncbi:hypothetical protein C7M84_019216 [Penaeus vannamei]|uniref:Uncharacterized protein n=1 Tax=Penaeus vannamei TaxID=6689 RepID=A0A423SFH8_PENVA|nr:hypothetical protein C7M84_019216 [Penaeus vannamei]